MNSDRNEYGCGKVYRALQLSVESIRLNVPITAACGVIKRPAGIPAPLLPRLLILAV